MILFKSLRAANFITRKNLFVWLYFRLRPIHTSQSLILYCVFRNRMSSGIYGENEDTDSDVGKWGHIVQVPDGYASAEDVARLYGLASLMSEGDDDEKMRRSV